MNQITTLMSLVASIALTAVIFIMGTVGGHDSQAEDKIAISLPGDSIYQLSGIWTDQDNATYVLSDFAGKPQVVSLVYAGCAQICPAIVATMQKIQADLPQGQDVGFLLVSLTPNQDTPEIMKRYLERYELDPESWKFIAGSPEDLRRLAMALGVKYKPSTGNDVSHSNLFTILDEQGRITLQQAGLYENAPKAVTHLSSMLSKVE